MSERDLFQTVINQAFHDFADKPRPIPKRPKNAHKYWLARQRRENRDRRNLIAEADEWLTGNSDDFRITCHGAGYDPDWIRRMHKEGRFDIKRFKAVAAVT